MTRGMDERIVRTEEFAGIKTGYSKLDSLIDGLKNGQLIIMGARPAMGKTTFACSLVDTPDFKANSQNPWKYKIQ